MDLADQPTGTSRGTAYGRLLSGQGPCDPDASRLSVRHAYGFGTENDEFITPAPCCIGYGGVQDGAGVLSDFPADVCVYIYVGALVSSS